MIYLLEYRSLVLEQLSHEAELKLLQTLSSVESGMTTSEITTGVLLACLIIRDFDGFGLHHVSSEGQAVLKMILEIAVANYPEQQVLSLSQPVTVSHSLPVLDSIAATWSISRGFSIAFGLFSVTYSTSAC